MEPRFLSLWETKTKGAKTERESRERIRILWHRLNCFINDSMANCEGQSHYSLFGYNAFSINTSHKLLRSQRMREFNASITSKPEPNI